MFPLKVVFTSSWSGGRRRESFRAPLALKLALFKTDHVNAGGDEPCPPTRGESALAGEVWKQPGGARASRWGGTDR